jgi:hypothetical protein
MRYLFRFLCVCALGVMPLVGCGDTTGTGGQGGMAGINGGSGNGGGPSLCDDLDLYDCIDQPSCTPTFRGHWDCSALTQDDCAKEAEGPAPEEGHGFCAEHIRPDGTSGFYYQYVTFCEQDSDCATGEECVSERTAPVLNMGRGECHAACVDECQQDADCPEGESCGFRLCGSCSFTGSCWDEGVRYCW